MRRGSRILAKAIALLILSVIGLDLGDSGCDPLRVGLGDRLLSPAPTHAPDACSDLCLPDCFCCATTVAAAAPARTGRPAVTLARSLPRLAPPASGYSIPIDHVPLAIL